jgi:ADP-heptose:LPS heptosyltransferase
LQSKPKENILLVRLKSMGDVLFTLPAVHQLREAFPEARITFLVSEEHAPLLRGFGDVQNVLALHRAGYKQLRPRVIFADLFGLLRRLRAEKFSLVVDFQGYGETVLLSRWTGAARRWGVAHRDWRKLAFTGWLAPNYRLHPAGFNLLLLQSCGVAPGPGPIRNEFVLPPEALEQARAFLCSKGLDPARRTLFIQPTTSTPQKNWPLEKYLAVGRHWQARGLQILFGGGPKDQAILEPVRQAGFPVAAGSPLLVSAGLANHSALVLGGDTGLLHLAVAMKRRVLMLMSSTDPGSTHPFQHANWALTPAPGKAVSSIPPDGVNQACAEALAEVPR